MRESANENCFATYLSCCSPFQLPPPWNFLAVDPWAFVGPPDPAAALAELTARHSPQQLLEAGLAQLDAQGCLALAPAVAIPEVTVLALRDSNSGDIYNLLTDAGCVTGDAWPLFAVLADQLTLEVFERIEKNLLLTGDVRDTIVLRSAGLAAAPIVGVTEFNERDLVRLEDAFGIAHGPSAEKVLQDLKKNCEELAGYDPAKPWAEETQPADETEDDEFAVDEMSEDEIGEDEIGGTGEPRSEQTRPYGHAKDKPAGRWQRAPLSPKVGGKKRYDLPTLTIVRWSPHKLSRAEPASIRCAIDALKQLRDFRGLETDEIYAWVPTPKDWQLLEFALTRQECSWVVDALLHSVVGDGDGGVDWEADEIDAVEKASDLASAAASLAAVLHADPEVGTSREQLMKARKTYQTSFQADVLKPLLEQAEATTDPLERALKLHFAELLSLSSEKTCAARECLHTAGATGRDATSETTKELLAISKQLTTLSNELLTWKRLKAPISTLRFAR